MADQIVWCDIPVTDLNRAIRFYSAVLGAEVSRQEFNNASIGLLPDADSGVSGCLVVCPEAAPASGGPLVYLNCEGRLDAAIAAMEANGGRLLKPKESIAPHGWRAVALDSEGNRIALHSK